MKTKRLETERCYLRKLNLDDACGLFENIFSDDRISRYMSWDCYTDVDSVKEYLTKWQDYYKQGECCFYLVLLITQVLGKRLCNRCIESDYNLCF